MGDEEKQIRGKEFDFEIRAEGKVFIAWYLDGFSSLFLIIKQKFGTFWITSPIKEVLFEVLAYLKSTFLKETLFWITSLIKM